MCELAYYAPAPAEHASQDCQRSLGEGGLGELVGAMPQGHVGDFVRHHPRQLGFVFGRLDGATVQVEETARQRKSVDGFLVDCFELVRIAVTGCVANQARAQPVQVVIDCFVLQRR